MKQTILTFIAPIDPDKRPQLESILETIRLNLDANAYMPFSEFSLLHFAGFAIVEPQQSAPLLVFENNFDGDLPNYLNELIKVGGPGLHHIYNCCPDYKQDTYNDQALKNYLQTKVIQPNAYHIGNVGRTVTTIRNNRQLRDSLQLYLDKLVNSENIATISASELRRNIQEFAKSNLPPALSAPLPPHQTPAEKLLPWIRLITIGLLAIILGLSILLPFLIIVVLVLRKKEESDAVQTAPASITHIENLIKTENQIAQNHLANLTPIKPGRFRLNLLKAVLFAANLLARISNKGKLSGIPSIHFAHWSIINNNKHLLFLSNFDSSWISYLDDFIDKASTGLTGIWSNTAGFPYTRFLVMEGARDELRFKAFARAVQVPSLVWYSAYADLTVQNIDKDSKIREQLLTPLSDTDTQKWLQLF